MKYKCGLIGHKISYSLSPVIHEQIAKFLDVKMTYDLIDISSDRISDYIDLLKKGIYQGFNVTKPYKEEVIAYMDELSPIAKKLRAVNTIYMLDGKIYGDNTDAYGFAYMLDYYHIKVDRKHVLVLGTGGASKAVFDVLQKRGAHIKFASRTPKGEHVIGYKDIYPSVFDIYINATPIGTYPHVEDCVLSQNEVSQQLVIDLIYRPKHTKLMQYAQTSYNGFMMLLAQAVKSEMLWLNHDISIHDTIDYLMEVIKYE